jgi:hypothetical protein
MEGEGSPGAGNGDGYFPDSLAEKGPEAGSNGTRAVSRRERRPNTPSGAAERR